MALQTYYDINVLAGTTAGAASAGMKEDLLDVITNISPTETPFWSSCPKGKAHSPNHEWLADSLTTASDSAAIEGAAFAGVSIGGRTRYLNYCMIVRHDVEVSGTVQASSVAGVTSELAYQKTRAMKELARDLEWNFFQSTSAAGTTAVARKMIGIDSAALTLGANAATSAAARVISKALIDTVWQSAWEDGANIDKMYCGAGRKRGLSALVTTDYGTRFITSEPGGRKVVEAIDIYEGDLGVIQVVLDRFCPTDTYYGLDSQYWRASILRPPSAEPVAKAGDSVRQMILTELTLEYRDPKASFVVSEIS